MAVEQNYPITNTQVYKFKDGTYCVTFVAHNVREEFRGTREEIVPQIALRIKRILHVR